MYRPNKYRNTSVKIIQKEQPKKNDESSVYLKDILIPLFSAVFAVGINQLFFVDNKLTEAQIELQKENIKAQYPTLNRILAFTYKYEETEILLISNIVYTDKITQINEATGEIIKVKEVQRIESIDTIKVTAPSFVLKKEKRNKLNADLEVLKENRDLLEHTVYIELDRLLTFLEDHPLPNIDSNDEIANSDWCKNKTVEEWNTYMENLRKSCYDIINSFSY